MGMDSKENKPKKKKKISNKNETPSKDTVPEEQNKTKQIIESSEKSLKSKNNPRSELVKEDTETQPLPSFAFISMTLKCTKCKYKKNMKRPQSFIPKENDLICPKCGSLLKKSRSK